MGKARAALGGQDESAVAGALSGGVSLPFAPWADGSVITSPPLAAVADYGVPLLVGNTANEFNMAWMANDWVSLDMVRAGLTAAGQELMKVWSEMDKGVVKGDRAFAAADQAVRNRQADASI